MFFSKSAYRTKNVLLPSSVIRVYTTALGTWSWMLLKKSEVLADLPCPQYPMQQVFLQQLCKSNSTKKYVIMNVIMSLTIFEFITVTSLKP